MNAGRSAGVLRSRHALWGLTVAAVIAAGGISGAGALARAGGGTVASRSAYTTATRLCGVARPRQLMAAARPPRTTAPVALSAAMSVGDIQVAGGLLYVGDGSRIDLLSASGAALRSVPVPWQRASGSFAVDPAGSLYVDRSGDELVKLDAAGAVVWSVSVAGTIVGVFGHRLGGTWVVGAVLARGVARLYTAAGRYVASRPMQGTLFTPAPDGGLVSTDGRYVRKYDANLRLMFHFGGSGAGAHPAAGQFDFYLQGAAVQLRDGRYLVADAGHGLEVLSSTGILLGTLTEAQLGLLTQRDALTLDGGSLYVATGAPFSAAQRVSRMPLASAISQALAPGPSTPPLGIGAGVRLGAAASYFKPGTRPSATAVFDPWWSQVRGLRLRYTVRDAAQVKSGAGASRAVILGAGAIRGGVPLVLPAAVPGPYEIDVQLVRAGRVLSAQCVDYSVGAPGDRLDVTRLPGSWNAGGVSGDRGAALADVFGFGGARISLDWTRMLPHGTGGATDFSAYDTEIAAASREAAARHVALSVQIGSGGPERAFVDDGTWGARVAQVVAHWKSEVHYWEAWNEPNSTYGTPANYVHNILMPFYAAVKASDPSAQVLGGTVVGTDLSYWQGIADAGGFRYMDIAGIHPYTEDNRSWEEEDFPRAFRALRAIMAASGAGSMAVWITELGWWSDGPYDFIAQADITARAQLWMRALGIPVWEQLMVQGTYGDGDLTYSLIQGDSLVKPAALAAMVEATQTSGRAFTGWLTSGLPMTYAASFGARAAGGGTMVALWTDDAALGVRVRLVAGGARSATLVDQYGASRRVSLTRPLRLALDGSVQYLELPAGDHVSVGPVEPFGPDLALASAGARASASSSAKSNPPALAIDGDFGAANVGDLALAPAWASARGDGAPTLTVRLAHGALIDRVLIATAAPAGETPGLRSWTVSVRTASGAWRVVGAQSNLFYERAVLTSFPAVRASAVRIAVRLINYGGYAGGAKPWFWSQATFLTAQSAQYRYGPAVVREVAVYGAGGSS